MTGGAGAHQVTSAVISSIDFAVGGILAAVSKSEDLWKAAETYTWEQDMRRGPWPTQRTAIMPNPPWSAHDNPMLEALLDRAHDDIESHGLETALLQLAVHCWFEGGIEGYDRGQADARGEFDRAR